MFTSSKILSYLIVFSVLFMSLDAFAQGLQGLAFGAADQGSETSDKISDHSYVLRVNDEIKITVYGENDLSNTYKIGSTGIISFPLIGDIQVLGMSTHQAKAMIEAKLADGYLKKPSVSLEVSSEAVVHREFYILGEVRTPGSYNYQKGLTVLEAVELAGGFTYRSNKKHVQVLKSRKDGSDIYEKMPVGEVVEPGDIILVKERYF